MDVSALLLSRVQFAFTISFHIIFPVFTIGLGLIALPLTIVYTLVVYAVFKGKVTAPAEYH
jgi:cytochrome bd ubiquinol oxidase subunit I